MIAPKFEEFSKTYTNVKFLKVDVDELSDVAAEAGIRGMPTFQVFVNGKKASEVIGADVRSLEEAIKKASA